MSTPEEHGAMRPLYVDLDGTLISTDTLLESICLFVRRYPWKTWALPIQLLRGKAQFKSYLAEWVQPDVSLLPYRPCVMNLIQRAREMGRRVVLATSSHDRIARAVAEHVGAFDDVLASDDVRNLGGETKLAAIRCDSNGGAFDYVGDSRADIPIWIEATHAYIAGDTKAVHSWFEARNMPTESLRDHIERGGASALLESLRPHQWSKNVLLFAPLVLAQDLLCSSKLVATCLAFLAFCAVASAGYLFNDMLDIEGDRRHPTKRARPLAAGRIGIPEALIAFSLLLAAGFGTGWILVSAAFAGMLLLYLVLTIAYSLVLKEKLFLDVLILAALYTHRIFAGGVASSVDVSPWLMAFSVFFFMSLALLKRYIELYHTRDSGLPSSNRIDRRAYYASDLGLIETMGISSGYLSVLVLGLYTSRPEVTRYYSNPDVLWLILPLMLYWISRIWFLANRGLVPEDPISFAMKDRTSYVVLGGILLVGLIGATLGPLE